MKRESDLEDRTGLATYGLDPLETTSLLSERSPLPLIAVAGETHTVRYVNPAFCKLSERDREDLIGEPFGAAVPEAQWNGCLALLDNVYRSGVTACLPDQLHTRADKAPAYWSYTLWLVSDADDSPAGVMVQISDTTEQVLARLSLSSFNERLVISGLHQHQLTEVAEEGIERLQWTIREADHRAKSNLQIISALLDLQVMGNAESVAVAELSQLQRSILTVASLHDILADATKTTSTAGTIAAESILYRLLPVWQGILKPKSLQLIAEDVRLPVKHGVSMAFIVNELITNAAKHGAGTVEIRLTADETTATLIVSDNGPGFPTGFEPALSTHFGLQYIEFLCRLELAGAVMYANVPGGGACVTIRFPLPTETNISERHNSIPFSLVFAPPLLHTTMRAFMAFANLLHEYAVMLLDDQGRILRWSVGAERLFGYSVREMLGQPLTLLFAPEDGPSQFLDQDLEHATHRGFVADDRWMIRKDGSRFFGAGTINALADSDLRGFVKVVRDATEQKVLQQDQVRTEARAAVDRERRRASQELHDTLSQGLTGIALQLESVKDILDEDPNATVQIHTFVDRALQLARQSLSEMRHAVRAMRSPLLENSDLPAALRNLVREMTNSTTVCGEVVTAPIVDVIPPELEEALLRIAQEALANALKHSDSAIVRVSLDVRDGVAELTVEDNGRGFDLAQVSAGSGLGLSGMQWRMDRVGGSLLIDGCPSRGVTITARVPLVPVSPVPDAEVSPLSA